MTTDRSGWLSVRAVLWVLDEALDVPPQLVAPLIGLARHADEDGANAYPSQSTLARYTRKTDRQVKKDLALLLELGLIRKPLDQSAATGLRADRRPTVYDLGCAPMRAHGGNYTTGRPVPGGTTRRVAQGRTGGTPGSNGVSSSSPEESLNNPLKKELQKKTSSSSAAQQRGQRIPADFTVSPAMLEWAREKTPLVGRTETENFVDYWTAASGRNATKLDWTAAWRTWMRNAQTTAERHQPRRQANGFTSQTDANIVAFLGRTGTDSNVLQLPRGES